MSGEALRTRSGGTVPAEAEREVVTVTWGKETFAPLRYHAMDIGPFSLSVSVRRGETIREAAGRAMAELDAMAKDEFDRKTAEFLARVRSLAESVRGGKEGDR